MYKQFIYTEMSSNLGYVQKNNFMRTVYIICYIMSLFVAVSMSYAFMTNQHIADMTTTGKTILFLVSVYCFLAFLYVPQLYKKG